MPERPQNTARGALVVAIQTLAGPSAGGQIYELVQEGPTSFRLVVPAMKPEYGWTYVEGQGRRDAAQRLELFTEFAHRLGIELTREIGVAEPRQAVLDAINACEEAV